MTHDPLLLPTAILVTIVLAWAVVGRYATKTPAADVPRPSADTQPALV